MSSDITQVWLVRYRLPALGMFGNLNKVAVRASSAEEALAAAEHYVAAAPEFPFRGVLPLEASQHVNEPAGQAERRLFKPGDMDDLRQHVVIQVERVQVVR